MGGTTVETVLANGAVIDGAGHVIDNGYVTMTDGIVSAVASGPPRRGADDTTVIDVNGATILPGLMNLHVHAQRRHLHRLTDDTPFRVGTPALESEPDEVRLVWAVKNCWAELLEGTTTVRDTGSGNSLNNKVRWVFDSGMLGGPRFVSSGTAIAMTGGHGGHYEKMGSVAADGPDGVRQAVRTQLRGGADWIKLMASSGIGGMPVFEDPRFPEYTVEEMSAGVREAHARRARVCAHAYFPQAIRNAVEAGVDCIEHGASLDEETVALMVARGTFYVPTMTGLAEVGRREGATGDHETSDLITEVVVKPHREAVAMAFAAGVRLGTGTDTLGQLISELKLMHEVGIPEMACVKAATSGSATVLGMADEVGTLAPGMHADVVVVGGSPLDDLDNLRDVQYVFKSGARVDPAWMVKSITDAMSRSPMSTVRAVYRRPSEQGPVP